MNYGNKLGRAFLSAVVLFSMLAGTVGRTFAQSGTYTLNIPASSPWYDTGINVLAGWQLSITATGLVSYNAFQIGGPKLADANGGDTSGENFFPDAVLPNAEIHSLIGKIGGTTSVGTGTPVPEGLAGYGAGFVGTSYSKPISTSGRLFLGYNDDVPYFYDNAGSFAVTVNVNVIPEPNAGTLTLLSILALVGIHVAARPNPSKHIRQKNTS